VNVYPFIEAEVGLRAMMIVAGVPLSIPGQSRRGPARPAFPGNLPWVGAHAIAVTPAPAPGTFTIGTTPTTPQEDLACNVVFKYPNTIAVKAWLS
jgi:hypothetical protein